MKIILPLHMTTSCIDVTVYGTAAIELVSVGAPKEMYEIGEEIIVTAVFKNTGNVEGSSVISFTKDTATGEVISPAVQHTLQPGMTKEVTCCYTPVRADLGSLRLCVNWT